jgi:hypothetical protein
MKTEYSCKMLYALPVDAICTIADSTYAPKAIAMLTSALIHMPDCQHFLLDIDNSKPKIHESPITVLSLKDIGLSESEIESLRLKYNVIEFATAVKPTLLNALVKRDFRSVTYLDPDIFVTSAISEAMEIAENHEVVVVPHRCHPPQIPNSEFEIMLNRVGIFNFGFVTLSKNSKTLLDWWQKKTFESGSMNWYQGQFTDQKWGDFFPAYFKTFILKHPGYNVASWNIDERPLMHLPSGEITASDEPLRFIHFSQSTHRLDEASVLKQWEYANKVSLKIVSSLALKYEENIEIAKSSFEFIGQISQRIEFKPIRYRLNFRDGFVAGLFEDWKTMRARFVRH